MKQELQDVIDFLLQVNAKQNSYCKHYTEFCQLLFRLTLHHKVKLTNRSANVLCNEIIGKSYARHRNWARNDSAYGSYFDHIKIVKVVHRTIWMFCVVSLAHSRD